MPKTSPWCLATWCYNVREAAGYGGERQMTEFAGKLGISAASLHDIESGATKTLGGPAWVGYLKVGANPEYLLHGHGLPMLREVEKYRRLHRMFGKAAMLAPGQIDAIERVIDSYDPRHPSDAAVIGEVMKDARERNDMPDFTGELSDEEASPTATREGSDPASKTSGQSNAGAASGMGSGRGKHDPVDRPTGSGGGKRKARRKVRG